MTEYAFLEMLYKIIYDAIMISDHDELALINLKTAIENRIGELQKEGKDTL